MHSKENLKSQARLSKKKRKVSPAVSKYLKGFETDRFGMLMRAQEVDMKILIEVVRKS